MLLTIVVLVTIVVVVVVSFPIVIIVIIAVTLMKFRFILNSKVFPELIFKWPKWSKDKDGKVKKCKTDQDCLMPQACCPHPILPGDKFCCTGFNDREMIAKYQEAYIDP